MGNNICRHKNDDSSPCVQRKRSQSFPHTESYLLKNSTPSNSIIDKQIGIASSFEKTNEIGPYFCGGSLVEKHAMSYQQRVEDFEGIFQEQREKKEQQLRKNSKNPIDLKQDLNSKFENKFNFLPDLLISVSPKVLSQSIRNGPPIKYRWISWKTHLIAITKEKSIVKARRIFKRSQKYASMSKEEEQINMDINRTFPSMPYFACKNATDNEQENNNQVLGYLPLKRVLIAISLQYPDLGYCQGMNFILGFILMINGANEAEAFWMFKSLSEHKDFMIMGLYENGLPLLKFLEYLAKSIMRKEQKELMEYFENFNIPDSFWLTKWIMTLFLYTFPPKICARFWDYVIANDIFSIIKLLVGLLDIFKQKFMVGDACDFLEAFNRITTHEDELLNPNSDLFINFNLIMKRADSCSINKKLISKSAKEFLKIFPSNQYAKLYSKYDNDKQFNEAHAILIQEKVKDLSTFEKVGAAEEEDDEISEAAKIIAQTTNPDVEINNSSNLQGKPSTNANLTTTMDFGMSKNVDSVQQSSEFGAQFQIFDSQSMSPSMVSNQMRENEVSNKFVNNQVVEEEEGLDETNSYADDLNDETNNKNKQMDKKEEAAQSQGLMRKQALLDHHQMAIEFDRESFQIFESLAFKSKENIDEMLNESDSVESQPEIDQVQQEEEAKQSYYENESEDSETLLKSNGQIHLKLNDYLKKHQLEMKESNLEEDSSDHQAEIDANRFA